MINTIWQTHFFCSLIWAVYTAHLQACNHLDLTNLIFMALGSLVQVYTLKSSNVIPPYISSLILNCRISVDWFTCIIYSTFCQVFLQMSTPCRFHQMLQEECHQHRYLLLINFHWFSKKLLWPTQLFSFGQILCDQSVESNISKFMKQLLHVSLRSHTGNRRYTSCI